MSDVLAANSPPKLGGVPFARFLANGGVVPQENHPVCAFLRRLRDIFINGAATPPNLGGEFFKVLLLLLCICSCSKQPSTLIQIQQQRSGDYTVTLLNDTGVLKEHSNKLMLEIRNASTNQLAPVSNVQIQATMRMPGMGPMFGNMSTTREIAPGRYEFDADFSMAGQWNFVVTFDPMGRVQFNLNAQ